MNLSLHPTTTATKNKMGAAAITANYEIGHTLKSTQVRDPIMFSRTINAMKLSFAFYLPKNCRHLGQNWRFKTNHLFARHYTSFEATN